MREVQHQGWLFTIDEERCTELYNSMDEKESKLRTYLPELTAFFDSVCVDITKPCDHGNDPADLCFWSFGSAISEKGYELDFYGENKFVSVVVSNSVLIPGRIDFEVFGVLL